MSTRKKIILDCDPGSDDAIAILLAAFSEDIDLLGITVTNGNRVLEKTLENALRVVEFTGKDIPVYAGCVEPMVSYLDELRKPNFPRYTLNDSHGDYMPLPEAQIKPEDMHAVNYLVEMFSEPDNDITLVTVGPLTNVAMALRLKPEIQDNIKEMVIMGGAVAGANISASAETNIFVDAEAAKIVMKSSINKVILPLDATWRGSLIDSENCVELREIDNKYTNFVADLVELRISALKINDISDHNHELRYTEGTVSSSILFKYSNTSAPCHDAMAVAYVIDPTVVTEYIDSNVDIDIGKGLSDGRMVVDYHNTRKTLDGVTSKVALNGDSGHFYTILRDALKKVN